MSTYMGTAPHTKPSNWPLKLAPQTKPSKTQPLNKFGDPNAKKEGNTEGIRTAGFIVSLIALIIGIIITIYLCLVVALVGTAVNGVFSMLQ